ncbi:MAG: hypothetical protein FWD63_02370 [Propionibacteriaceae bacterium]|nr:hypothetical protein [Propionibacteriaceae bacterium]
MPDYSEVPTYIDQIARAAIDAHMREVLAYGQLIPMPGDVPIEQGSYKLVFLNPMSEWGGGSEVDIACPDEAGKGGGQVTGAWSWTGVGQRWSDAGLAASYDQRLAFANIYGWVHGAVGQYVDNALQGWSNSREWESLPDPKDFSQTITTLTEAIALLKVEDTDNNIRKQIDGVCNALARADAGGPPMAGATIDLLRNLLTSEEPGGLLVLCKAVHDMLVALAQRAQAEQGIWDAARKDVTNITYYAIPYFQTWQPAQSVDLAPLTDSLAIGGILAALVPDGAVVGALLGILSAVVDLVDVECTDLGSQDNPAKSVDGLLTAFSGALNGDGGYGASLFNGVQTRERDLFEDLQTLNDNQWRTSATNEPVQLDPAPFSDPLQPSPCQSVDTDVLRTIANTNIQSIINDLNDMVHLVEDATTGRNSDAWLRPAGLGCNSSTTGAYKEWFYLSGKILNMIDTGAAAAIPLLTDVLGDILGFADAVDELQVDDAKSCEAVGNK